MPQQLANQRRAPTHARAAVRVARRDRDVAWAQWTSAALGGALAVAAVFATLSAASASDRPSYASLILAVDGAEVSAVFEAPSTLVADAGRLTDAVAMIGPSGAAGCVGGPGAVAQDATHVRAEYRLTCANSDALAAFDIGVFRAAPNAENLTVVVLTDSGAMETVVDPGSPRVDLSGVQ